MTISSRVTTTAWKIQELNKQMNSFIKFKGRGSNKSRNFKSTWKERGNKSEVKMKPMLKEEKTKLNKGGGDLNNCTEKNI